MQHDLSSVQQQSRQSIMWMFFLVYGNGLSFVETVGHCRGNHAGPAQSHVSNGPILNSPITNSLISEIILSIQTEIATRALKVKLYHFLTFIHVTLGIGVFETR